MCKQKWNLYKPNPAACKAGPVPINTQENMEYDPVSTSSILELPNQIIITQKNTQTPKRKKYMEYERSVFKHCTGRNDTESKA